MLDSNHQPRGQKLPFTTNQLDQICTHLTKSQQWRDLALFAVGLDTALRASDLLALNWEQVMVGGEITAGLRITQIKTRQVIDLELSAFARQALRQWRAKQPNSHLGTIFTATKNISGKPLCRQTYGERVKTWAEAIGLPPERYSTHSIRRSKAAAVYEHCRDVEVVRQILGHRSIVSTQNYLGINRDRAFAIAREVALLPKSLDLKKGVQP